MKKTLFDTKAVEELINRVNKLQADSQARWGSMTVTEMLLHCTLADTFILEDESEYQSPTLKNRLFKFIGIHVIPRFPRNRKGPARLNAKGKVDQQQFDVQKVAFINTLQRFPVHQKSITSIHPGMGYLQPKEWGIVAWMHMDHHLRQFGV
ncbi:DUF1569 domain-containing protein [Mucilaginibacter sp. AW1-3]